LYQSVYKLHWSGTGHLNELGSLVTVTESSLDHFSQYFSFYIRMQRHQETWLSGISTLDYCWTGILEWP